MQEWQEKIEADQRETQRRLTEVERKQQTEQIRVIVERQVEESPLLQQIYTDVGHLNTKVGTLEHEMQGARANILAIRDSQADFRDALQEVKDTMATKDDIKRLETDITSIKTTQKEILALLKQNRPES